MPVTFRFEPGDPADDAGERLVTTRLAQDPYALAVPAASPLARKRRLEVSDLASAKWCTAPLGSAATALVQRFCRSTAASNPTSHTRPRTSR